MPAEEHVRGVFTNEDDMYHHCGELENEVDRLKEELTLAQRSQIRAYTSLGLAEGRIKELAEVLKAALQWVERLNWIIGPDFDGSEDLRSTHKDVSNWLAETKHERRQRK